MVQLAPCLTHILADAVANLYLPLQQLIGDLLAEAGAAIGHERRVLLGYEIAGDGIDQEVFLLDAEREARRSSAHVKLLAIRQSAKLKLSFWCRPWFLAGTNIAPP